MVRTDSVSHTVAVFVILTIIKEKIGLTFTFAPSGCLPLEGDFGQLPRKRKYLFKTPYQAGRLSPEDISTIMQEEKANQQEKVSFKTGDLRKFFPKSYSAAQMQETILKLLSEYQRKRQRAAER